MEIALYLLWPALLALYNMFAAQTAAPEARERLRKRTGAWLIFQLFWFFLGPILLFFLFPVGVN